ncbi:maleylpyruvate isomerase family mycothiol-dependent enzyme [Kribbella deserti]|uniref:Maleylpyruvate isomerase family mycothiol-dependent enzyme n=1 Tax=Kribbella deserti TaxID=1926257 RepID=A0ABV6QK97_9ACTN
MLTPEFYLRTLRADAGRLAEVARMGLKQEVPSCPGWTVETVVRHTAMVYLHKVEAIRRNARPDPWPPTDLDDRNALELYDDATARLFAQLTESGPSAPSWTWWPEDQTSGFWFRRMAQETAVHRVDAELAHDVLTPIDSELALDGIDEVLRLMLGGEWDEGDTKYPVNATIRLTSDGRSWTVALSGTEVTVTGGTEGEVVAEIFGEPDALLLWLWGRRADDAVEAAGSADVARQFRARLKEATQ